MWCCCCCFVFTAESVHLQKESAVIEAKAEEHKRALSEVKHLLVKTFMMSKSQHVRVCVFVSVQCCDGHSEMNVWCDSDGAGDAQTAETSASGETQQHEGLFRAEETNS